MIDPPPVDWTDVPYDPAAARDGADACDSLAARIVDVEEWSRAQVEGPLATWEGAAATQFFTEEAALRADLLDRRHELRTRATALREAADAAEAEQHRREAEREGWFAWDRRRRESAA